MEIKLARLFRQVFVAIALISMAACQPSPILRTPAPSISPTSRLVPTLTPSPTPILELPPVRTAVGGFTVNGQSFRFIGADSIYFGFYQQYGYSIDQAIQEAKANGLKVLRIYLGYGTGTWSSRPAEEYDRALDIASRNGIYVIAVLTDCCCMTGAQGQTVDSYYSGAPYCNFSSSTGVQDYKQYIKSVLSRRNTVNGKLYKDDTTIMAWDIVNEPYLQNLSDAELNAWLVEVTDYIKSLDPNHLLTFGLDDSGSKYDTDGPYYTALNAPSLDFFSIHFNLPNYYSVSQQLERLQFRVQKFLSMGKPVILEEFGVGTLRDYGHNLDAQAMENWVKSYKDQMDITFSAGGSGALFWGWGVPETANVPLWWRHEDHDITETAFCDMLQQYQIPALGSVRLSQRPVVPPNDNFDGPALDLSKWQPNVTGAGTVAQENGRVALSVGANPPFSSTSVNSTWKLSGDFDIQIDFEIGEGWGTPAAEHLDGAVLGVSIAGNDYHITRLRDVNQDLFFGWSGDGTVLGQIPTTAVKGKYRLSRSGKTLTMYYDTGAGWQPDGSVEVASDPAGVYFSIASVNAAQAFTTYFDTFLVNSGTSNYQP